MEVPYELINNLRFIKRLWVTHFVCCCNLYRVEIKNKFEILKEKSDLPQKPDFDKVNNFMVEINENYFNI